MLQSSITLFLILLYKFSFLNSDALQKIKPPAAAAKFFFIVYIIKWIKFLKKKIKDGISIFSQNELQLSFAIKEIIKKFSDFEK